MERLIRHIAYDSDGCSHTIFDYDRTRDKMISVVENKLAELGGDYSTTCLTTLVEDDAKQAIFLAKASIGTKLTDKECFIIIERLNQAAARVRRMIATMVNEKLHPI